MENVIEIVRIKQEIREVEKEYGFLKEVQITNVEIAINAVCKLIGDEDREVFLVLVLNSKSKITAVHRCHIGSLSASVVEPREVFKSAILNNGRSIIVAHNHPSLTDQTPSSEDVAVTKRLKKCGDILGIELLDHLIVGIDTGISMRQGGYF